MSVLQEVTTASRGSADARSIRDIASARRSVGEPLVDRTVERKLRQLRGIWRIVGLWLRRRHDRHMLRSLSVRDVHDFCPRLSEAEAEMNKPFWRA